MSLTSKAIFSGSGGSPGIEWKRWRSSMLGGSTTTKCSLTPNEFKQKHTSTPTQPQKKPGRSGAGARRGLLLRHGQRVEGRPCDGNARAVRVVSVVQRVPEAGQQSADFVHVLADFDHERRTVLGKQHAPAA